MLFVDRLVNFKRLLVIHDTTLATGHHQSPLNLLWLDLTRPLQVKWRLLIHALLHIIDSQPCIGVNICWQHSITFQVIVERLLLIILLKIKIKNYPEENASNSCQNPRIIRNLRQYNLIPLKRLFSPANNFINISNLEQHLWQRDKSLNLFQRLKRLHKHVQLLVNISQIIQGLNTIRFNTNRLKIVLLRPPEIIFHEQTITLIDKSLCIVSVIADGDVHITLGLRIVVLQKE